MDELERAVREAFPEEVHQVVLSNPAEGPYKKITMQRRDSGFFVERLTEKQAFHQTLEPDGARLAALEALRGPFRQLNAWDGRYEYAVKVSRKGKVLSQRRPSDRKAPEAAGHNRVKQYLLPEGAAIPPLVDMGVFTSEGRVVRSMYDKYRQINRFVELIDDEVRGLDPARPISVIDFGCGKSYLTFILYYYLTQVRHMRVSMVGLDLKEDVIARCGQAARKYGYEGLRFELGDINGYQCDGPVDLVVTLHACDTATDYALFNAVRWGARLIYSAPCCQHELNGQMASEEFGALTRYGIVKERTAALMTDAIRGNLLECCGYKTQLLEFIDLAHTPKNILIRARRSGPPAPSRAAALLGEVERLNAAFSLRPTLYGLLREDGRI